MRWTDHSTEFENPPPGSHLARCYSLIDLGTQSSNWQGKEIRKRKVRISFELPYCKMEGTFNADLKGKPFAVHMQVTQSLDRRSKLRQLLEGWRGKLFEQHELEEYDPHKLLGLPCRLSLIESDSGWINVDSISRVTKEEEKAMPALSIPKVYVSLEPEDFDERVFESLTDRTKEQIMKTPEWGKLQEAIDREMRAEVESRDAPETEADFQDIPF